MIALANLSIRKKLVGIILAAIILTLGSGFALVILNNLRLFEGDLLRMTGLIARTVGDYTAIFLYFEEEREAERSLAQLARFDYVTDAHLYDIDGKLFASYRRFGNLDPPQTLPESTCEVRQRSLHCVSPVLFDGQRYGTIYVRGTAEPLTRRAREHLIHLAALMAALIVVALVLAWFLQGLISRPILHLAEQTEKVSNIGDYSVRVHKPSNDEIGQLYDGFNNMLSQIQRRQEELERSNRDLDQFAYVASHDLKAPLRAISTLASWIEEDLEGQLSSEAKEQIGLLKRRVQRMDALIEGILCYSRTDRIGLEVENVAVAELLDEILEMQSLPAGMTVTLTPALPVFEARRLRLEQVFANLITNAIKYHHQPERGNLRISAARRGDYFEFTVEDDGPGIAPEHHERVFMMFQTLEPKDKLESTGLGLALVKKLVEEEGGALRLESAAGAGARFHFTWPAKAPTPVVEPPTSGV